MTVIASQLLQFQFATIFTLHKFATALVPMAQSLASICAFFLFLCWFIDGMRPVHTRSVKRQVVAPKRHETRARYLLDNTDTLVGLVWT